MWTTKYKPQHWSEVVGNRAAIREMKQWLQDFRKKTPSTPRVLLLHGPEGCGKSLVSELLLKKGGYALYTFGANEIRNHKRDKRRTSNFCNLYMSDLRQLGSGNSRMQAHGIIVEDYNSLTKNDKKFKAALMNLLTKSPSPITPMIITSTDLKTIKKSRKLKSVSKVVSLDPLQEKDLANVAMRIAIAEDVYMDQEHAELFAKYAFGDARAMIGMMEMFYVGRDRNDQHISLDQLEDWLRVNCSHRESKQCMAFEGDISRTQTDEEKILGSAIGDRRDIRTESEQASALRLARCNSLQFMPILYQAYPSCLPMKQSKRDRQQTFDNMAAIADSFSLAETDRSNNWRHDTDLGSFSVLSIEVPIKLLRQHKKTMNTFQVDAEGYQTYYGIENTITNQRKVQAELRSVMPSSSSVAGDVSDFQLTKDLFAHYIKTLSPEQMAEKLWQYRLHPNNLDLFKRLKGGINPWKCTGKQKRLMRKRWEELEEEHQPKAKRAKPAVDDRHFIQNPETQNDRFMLDW